LFFTDEEEAPERYNDCLGRFWLGRTISSREFIGLLAADLMAQSQVLPEHQNKKGGSWCAQTSKTNMAQVAAPVAAPVTATFQTFLSDPVFATYVLCVVILTVKMVRATFRFQISRF
jgi:hypothetical protein